jgi:diguanylate cyclase (GGDEF)-like protein
MECDCMDIPEGMIRVTISLGVATYGRGGGHDVNALVKSADTALYGAKAKGRNCVEIASDLLINEQTGGS